MNVAIIEVTVYWTKDYKDEKILYDFVLTGKKTNLDDEEIKKAVNKCSYAGNKNDYEYVVTKIERKIIENNELNAVVNQMIDNGIFHVDVVDSDSHKMSSYTKSRRTLKVEPWYAIQEFIYPLV